jgi:hypothetical protein
VTPLIVAEIRWFRSPTVTKNNNSILIQHLNPCYGADKMQRPAMEKHKQSPCQKPRYMPREKKQSQWGTNKQISMHTKPKTSLFMVTSQCHIALNQIIPNSEIS